ncbi:Receptor-type tyrosine-protein phosphatase gamma, partial [Dissostichus eleginoides]
MFDIFNQSVSTTVRGGGREGGREGEREKEGEKEGEKEREKEGEKEGEKERERRRERRRFVPDGQQQLTAPNQLSEGVRGHVQLLHTLDWCLCKVLRRVCFRLQGHDPWLYDPDCRLTLSCPGRGPL